MTTTASAEQADDLARRILSKKLAACVQIQSVQSHYLWNDELRREPEFLLFIKTSSAQTRALEELIRAQHTYATPEIIELTITAGSAAYLRWIDEATRI